MKNRSLQSIIKNEVKRVFVANATKTLYYLYIAKNKWSCIYEGDSTRDRNDS